MELLHADAQRGGGGTGLLAGALGGLGGVGRGQGGRDEEQREREEPPVEHAAIEPFPRAVGKPPSGEVCRSARAEQVTEGGEVLLARAGNDFGR